jgi:hypothetical protein
VADGGVDVQLTEKYLVISDPLIDPCVAWKLPQNGFELHTG